MPTCYPLVIRPMLSTLHFISFPNHQLLFLPMPMSIRINEQVLTDQVIIYIVFYIKFTVVNKNVPYFKLHLYSLSNLPPQQSKLAVACLKQNNYRKLLRQEAPFILLFTRLMFPLLSTNCQDWFLFHNNELLKHT